MANRRPLTKEEKNAMIIFTIGCCMVLFFGYIFISSVGILASIS